MRIGIFGGSFDPVHRGHLALAESCRRELELDRVLFIPTANQPLKPTGPIAPNQDRLAMLELAIADEPQFEVSTIELDRGGVSYMVDTLGQLREERPQDELYLLIGADALADLPRWRKLREICELATLVVVNRPGQPEPDFQPVEAQIAAAPDLPRCRVVTMPPHAISSTEIRAQIDSNDKWREHVPTSVADYISERRLYRKSS